MKLLFGLLSVLTFSAMAQAQTDCGADIHPKDKVECLLKQVIADGLNAEIISQVELFTKSGLTASTEISSAFVGGTCASAGNCTFKYVVSTDYYTLTTFKSIVVLIEASNGVSQPTIKKVISQADL